MSRFLVAGYQLLVMKNLRSPAFRRLCARRIFRRRWAQPTLQESAFIRGEKIVVRNWLSLDRWGKPHPTRGISFAGLCIAEAQHLVFLTSIFDEDGTSPWYKRTETTNPTNHTNGGRKIGKPNSWNLCDSWFKNSLVAAEGHAAFSAAGRPVRSFDGFAFDMAL